MQEYLDENPDNAQFKELLAQVREEISKQQESNEFEKQAEV